MKEHLSGTDRGRQWLGNFAPDDRSRAAQLLDSIRTVSASTFGQNLRREIVRIAKASDPPVAIHSVRDVQRDADLGSVITSQNREAGSEAVVANQIRNAVKEVTASGICALADPGLIEMRDAKVRTVIFVDDYCGSGDAATRYLDSWAHSRTIRSWRSAGYLQMAYLVYAASPVGLAKLKGKPTLLDAIKQVEPGHDLWSTQWSRSEREEMFALCRRYSSIKGGALGYKRAGGLFIAVHTVPNSLPAIFRQEVAQGRKAVWYPFVQRARGLDADEEATFGDHLPPRSVEQAIKDMGRRGLARSLGELENTDRKLLLVVMAAISRRRKDANSIAEEVLRSVPDVSRALKMAISLGFVEERSGRLTDAGRRELGHTRRRRSRPALEDHDEPYYPHQLRG